VFSAAIVVSSGNHSHLNIHMHTQHVPGSVRSLITTAALVFGFVLAGVPSSAVAQSASSYRIAGIRAYQFDAGDATNRPSIGSVEMVASDRYLAEWQKRNDGSALDADRIIGSTSSQVLVLVDIARRGSSTAVDLGTITVSARSGTKVLLQETRPSYRLFGDRTIPFLIDKSACANITFSVTLVVGGRTSRSTVMLDNDASECHDG